MKLFIFCLFCTFLVVRAPDTTTETTDDTNKEDSNNSSDDTKIPTNALPLISNSHPSDWGCCRICKDINKLTLQFAPSSSRRKSQRLASKMARNSFFEEHPSSQVSCCPVCPFLQRPDDSKIQSLFRKSEYPSIPEINDQEMQKFVKPSFVLFKSKTKKHTGTHRDPNVQHASSSSSTFPSFLTQTMKVHEKQTVDQHGDPYAKIRGDPKLNSLSNSLVVHPNLGVVQATTVSAPQMDVPPCCPLCSVDQPTSLCCYYCTTQKTAKQLH